MKGRAVGGSRYHLKPEQVTTIKEMLTGGLSPRRISNDLDVNYHTVCAIRAGRSYKE